MRLLFVLRGIPGSGKSTFITQNHLENYTLSPDEYRIRLGAITYNEQGKLHISNYYDSKAWKLMYNDLEQRMKDGHTTVIDATHTRESYFNDYNKLCEKYRYRMIIIEFNQTVENALLWNKQRPEYKQVKEEAIHKLYQAMQNPLSLKYQKMLYRYDYETRQLVKDDIKTPISHLLEPILNPIDLNLYESISVVGDIHGCYTALIEALKECGFIKNITEDNQYEFDNNMFLIFVGDYIDRGIENKEVIDFLYQLLDMKNVKFLEGNHESHILKLSYENGWKNPYEHIGYAKETCSTVYQLDEEHKKKLSKIAHKCGVLFDFIYDNKIYQVTHAPIPQVVDYKTSTKDIIRGMQSVYYECQNIDEAFNANNIQQYGCKVYSIHGHANSDPENIKIQNTERTFNLCDDVEKGGNIRILKITK